MHVAHERRFATLDLNLLRVFATVERERSVGRAASTLAVSQSAVSHALARLRDHLGDPLFVRQGKRIAPTPFATAIAPLVRDALGDLERAVERRASFDPRVGLEQVRIAMARELEPFVLPPLVARMRAENPELVVTSTQLDRRNVRAELAARRLDAVIDVAHLVSRDVAHERLLVDELCVLARRNRRALDRRSYLAAEHVAVSARPQGPVLEDYRLAPDAIQRRIAVRCQSYEAARRLVATSDLLLTLPRRFAERRGLLTDVRVFAAPVSLGRVEFHQYWLAALADDPATRWLRDHIRAVFV